MLANKPVGYADGHGSLHDATGLGVRSGHGNVTAAESSLCGSCRGSPKGSTGDAVLGDVGAANTDGLQDNASAAWARSRLLSR